MQCLNLKKQINETRKEKEKMAIQIKQVQKQIENLNKRKETLSGDSAKLLMNFKDAIQLE